MASRFRRGGPLTRRAALRATLAAVAGALLPRSVSGEGLATPRPMVDVTRVTARPIDPAPERMAIRDCRMSGAIRVVPQPTRSRATGCHFAGSGFDRGREGR